MKKTLAIRETRAEIVLRIKVTTSRGSSTREIARFIKGGMGYVALGGAGRAIIKSAGLIDEITFDGHSDTYEVLVDLGVIEPQQQAA